MRLLIIRHAIAEDRDAFATTGRADEERPLTDRGRKRMQTNALGLSLLVPKLDVLVSSPYTRAVETAQIVSRVLRLPGPDAIAQHESLAHDRAPREFVDLLAQRAAHRGEDAATDTIAAVGHEPHLGLLIAWCTSGGSRSFVELKKGGACLLQFDGAPARAAARMSWLMQPSELRSLARD